MTSGQNFVIADKIYVMKLDALSIEGKSTAFKKLLYYKYLWL